MSGKTLLCPRRSTFSFILVAAVIGVKVSAASSGAYYYG